MSDDEANKILDFVEDNDCLSDDSELLEKVVLLLHCENPLFRRRAAGAMSEPECSECCDQLFERLIVENDRDVRSRIFQSLEIFKSNKYADRIINEYSNVMNSRSSKISIAKIALDNNRFDFASSKVNDDYIIGDLIEMHQESLLLFAIHETLTDQQHGRYAELVAKRRSATLTEAEYAKLLELSGLVEAMDARRLELLSQLAALRQVPLIQLISELNLPQHTV
ncbi:hypothetical protein [Armatimonas sp.]|uniref:hypothetical protein n=1 Tax=Armatimonas sp. TaxID=1872638 RepID=UPI00286C099D|nr:hypothetical protein [Armatimonas sp.]